MLELGGNAACIVDEGVDVEHVARRIIFGAFYQSGQSCISVQRIIAHETIYEHLKQLLREQASALKSGDPLDESTFLGPMISLADASASSNGSTRPSKSGPSSSAAASATASSTTRPSWKTSSRTCESVARRPSHPWPPWNRSPTSAAVEIANDGVFGLQTGVFTRDLDRAFYAFRELEVGGVIVNDVPSFRVDNMPYGGVKDSGFGREGVRFAMEDMTEMRLMVMNKVGYL